MKKKDIDIFAILIGIIIGCLFGYFIGMRVNSEKTDSVDIKNPAFGNIYLLEITRSNNIEDLHNTFKDSDIPYEIVEKSNFYYVYSAIGTDSDVIEAKKVEYEQMGFTPVVKNEYILDWPNKYITDEEKFIFYEYAITMLINSINNDEIIIDEKYALNPIDLEVYSNINLLYTIKNPKIKEMLHLDTYKILHNKLN